VKDAKSYQKVAQNLSNRGDELGAAGFRAEAAFAKQPNGPLDAGRAGFD
jgi:hypothetical protein